MRQWNKGKSKRAFHDGLRFVRAANGVVLFGEPQRKATGRHRAVRVGNKWVVARIGKVIRTQG